MSERSERKAIRRAGARRFSGGIASAWAAHKGRECGAGCWYCGLERRKGTSGWKFIPSVVYAGYRKMMGTMMLGIILAGCAPAPLWTCSQTNKMEQTAAGVAHERTVTMTVYSQDPDVLCGKERE